MGGELNKVTHFYVYESMKQREEVRAAAQRDKAWVAYVDAGRRFMTKQVRGRGARVAYALGTTWQQQESQEAGCMQRLGSLVNTCVCAHARGTLCKAQAEALFHLHAQESRIMVEATGLYKAVGASGAAAFTAPESGRPGMYEWRQYQLHPGYGSVPKLLKAFEEG